MIKLIFNGLSILNSLNILQFAYNAYSFTEIVLKNKESRVAQFKQNEYWLSRVNITYFILTILFWMQKPGSTFIAPSTLVLLKIKGAKKSHKC